MNNDGMVKSGPLRVSEELLAEVRKVGRERDLWCLLWEKFLAGCKRKGDE